MFYVFISSIDSSRLPLDLSDTESSKSWCFTHSVEELSSSAIPSSVDHPFLSCWHCGCTPGTLSAPPGAMVYACGHVTKCRLTLHT